MKVCLIVSNFYPKISKLLINGAISKLKKNKISNFRIIDVPGTYEIPVVLSNMINKYDAFIVLGCIIRGQTSHFHYLCSSVTNALMNLSIKYKKPNSGKFNSKRTWTHPWYKWFSFWILLLFLILKIWFFRTSGRRVQGKKIRIFRF